eukprot:Gb_25823 [translate_table: standard]
MKEENQDVQIDSTGLIPPKRKRGRPRKTHLLYPGEKALIPQRLDGKKKPRRKKIDSSLSSFTDNAFVGQTVHGVLDGSFDAGYLLTVRVGDTDTVLRGVVFEPGLSVPISKANDIAPNVKLTKRDESILVPELPQPAQNATPVVMPSTPVPLLPAPMPVVNAQGTTSVSIPDQTAPPLEVASEQTSLVSLKPNGSPQKSLPDHSVQTNEEPTLTPCEPVSQPPELIPHPAEPVESQMNVGTG